MRETWVQPLDWKDALEKEMATHSCILVWEIPWIEECGGLQSIGSQWVGHDLATKQQHKLYRIIPSTSGVKYFFNDSSSFPKYCLGEQSLFIKYPYLKKKFPQCLLLGSPVFTNMQPCEQSWAVIFLHTEYWERRVLFQLGEEQSSGMRLIQTRWVATSRCDKNRNTLQTFQALSSSPGQEVGRLSCSLIYLLTCSLVKECWCHQLFSFMLAAWPHGIRLEVPLKKLNDHWPGLPIIKPTQSISSRT